MAEGAAGHVGVVVAEACPFVAGGMAAVGWFESGQFFGWSRHDCASLPVVSCPLRGIITPILVSRRSFYVDRLF